MRRLTLSLIATLAVANFVAVRPAAAQQSLNLFVGGFVPRSLDSRPTTDVTFNNLNFADFDPNDFNGVTVGGEWLIGLSDKFDAGLGIGYYQSTSTAAYSNFSNPNGSDILFDQKLRIAPFTATFRFLPLGHRGPFRPYLGAGVAIESWRYTESGEFVDESNNNNLFRDTFTGSGTETAPVVLGGALFPMGGPASLGAEIRWQGGKADLPASDFVAGRTVNLGGMSYLFVFNLKF